MGKGIVIVLGIVGIFGVFVFFGLLGGVSKTFTQATPDVIDSSSVQEQEHQTIEDIKQKQQKMMDDLRQKMEDARARQQH